MNNDIVAIDLFCGAGGLTRGLINSGIKVVAGIDNDNNCKYPYEKNNNIRFILSDIKDIRGKDLLKLYPKKSIKLLAGCAPCQPFSSYARNVNSEKDGRFYLLKEFLRLITEITPDIVTMENVPRLRHKEIFKMFNMELKEIGYNTSNYVVSCVDYGIPQKRKRLVFFATKKQTIINIIDPIKTKTPTVRDTIFKLQKIDAGETSKSDPLHRASRMSEINLKRIKYSKPGGTWNDWDFKMLANCHKKDSGKTFHAVYGRMEWDKPAPTITTQCTGFGNGRFGHPEQNRAISLREAALLQTFPKNYSFGIEIGTPFVSVRRMIGNAVPVLLGGVIGKSIIKHLREENK